MSLSKERQDKERYEKRLSDESKITRKEKQQKVRPEGKTTQRKNQDHFDYLENL